MSILYSLLVLAAYVVLSISGLSLIKEAESLLNARFFVGGVLYGAGFLIWILLIIRMFPLSVAFPLSAGALIVGTQFAGLFYLKESLSALHLAGVAAILMGIVLIFKASDGA